VPILKPKSASNSKRVRWLERAYDQIRKDLLVELPTKCEITIGFTNKRNAVSQVWHKGWVNNEGNNVPYIIIHPKLLENQLEILAVLLHECIHILYPHAGHKGAFADTMKRVGLEGKPTKTKPNKKLRKIFQKWQYDKLGKYPFCRVNLTQIGKKQTTRLRKYICGHGQILRAATDELMANCEVCSSPFKLVDLKEK